MILKANLVYFFVCVYSKTIRSRIYTNANGTRELIFADGSDVKQGDVDFLLKNLNLTDDIRINLPGADYATAEEEPSERTTITNESIFMQHWNSLTEVGWKNFSEPMKKMYLNSTRILRLAPEFKSDGEVNETSAETTEVTPSDEESPNEEESPATSFDLCQSIIDICQVLQPQTDLEHLLSCLTSKNETLLRIVEESLDKDENVTCLEGGDEGQGETPRSILRPRRFLHKVLLPLLVVIVIKYLVTIPFVAVSVFTLNAMWLGLLSLGAVLFAKLKNHDPSKLPNRRLNPLTGSEYLEYGNSVTGPEIYWSPIRIPVAQSRISPH